jgi:hypothetical protein
MPALANAVVVYGPARPPFFRAATRKEAVDDVSFVPGDVAGFPPGVWAEVERDSMLTRHGSEGERGSATVDGVRVPAWATTSAERGGVSVMTRDHYERNWVEK